LPQPPPDHLIVGMRSSLLAALRTADRLATALDPLPDYPANIFPLRRPSTPPDALLELDFGTTAPSPHAFTLLEAEAVVRVQPAATSNPAPATSLNLPCPA
jgi:hypothetical protein